MLKKYLLLLVAVLGGAGGLVLRRMQLEKAFEPDTGLPIPGAPATWMIALFSLVVLALLFALSLMAGRRDTHPVVVPEKKKTPLLALLCFTASAALALAAAILDFRAWQVYSALPLSETRLSIMLLLFASLTVLSGAAIFLIGLQHHRGKTLVHSALLLLPAYGNCLWLLYSYQRWVSDPIIGDYIFALFAIMSGMLAHYFIAAHSFQKPRGAALLLFTSIAIFTSFISLSYGGRMADTFLFAAQILYFVPSLLLYFEGRFTLIPHPTTDPDVDVSGAQHHTDAPSAKEETT